MDHYLEQLLTLQNSLEAKEMMRKGKTTILNQNSSLPNTSDPVSGPKNRSGKTFHSKTKKTSKDSTLSYLKKTSSENKIK